MKRAALLVLMAVGALLVAPLAGRAGDEVLDQLQVVDSVGAAAAVGTVIRLPAEDPGGAVFSSTRLDKDKAFGRAAGFFPGSLMTTYLQTSFEAWTNPSLAEAQYPPGGAFPEEASAAGRTELPGGYGEAFTFTAKAASQTDVVARAATGQVDVPEAGIRIDSAVTRSSSRVEDDATVVTEVRSELTGVSVGEVLTIQEVTSVAETRVPKEGVGSSSGSTVLSGMQLNGVPAELSDRGLVIGDRTPVSPAQIVAFNEGLAALDEQGLLVFAFPGIEQEKEGRAASQVAALQVRYAPEGGGGFETELLLGQAHAQASSVAYEPVTLDGLGTAPSLPDLADDAPPVVASGGRVPSDVDGGVPGATVGGSLAGDFAEDEQATAANDLAPADDGDDFLLTARPASSPSDRMRSGYGVIVVIAFVAIASLAALRRATSLH